MTDPVVLGVRIVEFMDRHDHAALQALFPPRYWEWFDNYLHDQDGWPTIEALTGSPRAIVNSRELSPSSARLFLEGERGQAVVTVSFDDDGKVAGFALDGEEYNGIGTVVISCPPDRRPELSAFYDALLGTDVRRIPRLGFGEGRHYQPPRWPDPAHPAQMHLDIDVTDIDQAANVLEAHGADLLHDAGGHLVYADPIGHPFCLYPGDSADQLGVLTRIVVDCSSPRSLATFYEQLLDLPLRVEDSPERVVVGRQDRRLPLLAFQHIPTYAAPRWPDPAHPAQVHFDMKFDNRPAAEEIALRAGAVPLPPQGGSCPVYADPADHPFCLCTHGE